MSSHPTFGSRTCLCLRAGKTLITASLRHCLVSKTPGTIGKKQAPCRTSAPWIDLYYLLTPKTTHCCRLVVIRCHSQKSIRTFTWKRRIGAGTLASSNLIRKTNIGQNGARSSLFKTSFSNKSLALLPIAKACHTVEAPSIWRGVSWLKAAGVLLSCREMA